MFPAYSGEDYSGTETPSRIERALDRTHLFDAVVAIELAQQRLLHRAAADAMLGERAAAEPCHLAAELEDRGSCPCSHVVVASRDHVRMDVAVGDVSPDRVIEPARLEPAPIDAIISAKRSNGTIMSAAVFAMRAIDGPLRLADALIHAGGHRLANARSARSIAPVIAGQRELCRLQDAEPLEQAAERGAMSPVPPDCRPTRSPDIVARSRCHVRRQLQLHEQRDRVPSREGHVVAQRPRRPPQHGNAASVHVLDCRRRSMPDGLCIRHVFERRVAAVLPTTRWPALVGEHGIRASAICGAGDTIRKRDLGDDAERSLPSR